MTDTNMDFIPDLPKGPLDEYRELVPDINWKRLKVYLEGEEAVRVKYRTFKIMESHPIFDREGHPNADEQKRIAAVQMMKIKELNMFPPEIYSLNFRPRVSDNPDILKYHSKLNNIFFPLSTAS